MERRISLLQDSRKAILFFVCAEGKQAAAKQTFVFPAHNSDRRFCESRTGSAKARLRERSQKKGRSGCEAERNKDCEAAL